MKFLVIIVLIFSNLWAFNANATHNVGGDITYECVGGDYVFQLTFYRDCNGAPINDISQQLAVWNHPTISSITVNFIDRIDISPTGTSVAGGTACTTCGSGGIGALEKVIYRSNPINFSGIPPAQGWIITYENFSRPSSIDNILNPDSYGITLATTIFNSSNPINSCVDNSVQFLQEPYFVTCAGQPYKLNFNAVDPDLDSIAVAFAQPLNHINGGVYNPPSNPAFLPYIAGFSATSPTPGPSINPSNITASIDAQSGELTFTSFTTGEFAIKIQVKSYRNGQLISITEREMVVFITACPGSNNAPIITAPFAGSFETTINAGDIISFTLSSTDTELLQDGSPQSNTILPTGLLFSSDYTSGLGCIIEPCANLSSVPTITGIQGATVDFSWQTDCDHLIDANGNEQDMVPYHFVFRVQDDYCPVPKVVYETVTINVVNPGVIQAPTITCIQGSTNDDFTVNWTPVADPSGTFIAYELYSLQDGLIGTIPSIATTSFTHTGVTQETDYYVVVRSGCSGNAIRSSDTIKGIFLDLSNLNPSIAVLNWNEPMNPLSSSFGDYYHIYREYPAGTWTIIDSVPTSITQYEDIIDICDIFLNYQVVLPNQVCDFSSQIEGNLFNDQIPPDIPVVSSVSIDTLSGETTLIWNQNAQPDTYGYLIYMVDPTSGFLVELDTIYGIADTSFTYLEPYTNGSVTYTVAAFDSCESVSGAPFNLSARDPNFNGTIYTETSLDICSSSINLSWSDYIGWDGSITNYEVFVRTNNSWSNLGLTSDLVYSFQGEIDSTYCFAVKANHQDGRFSFSNISCITVQGPPIPSYHYLNTATVLPDETVQIDYSFDPNAKISKVELERLNDIGSYEVIQSTAASGASISFIDEDVDVQSQSYQYRVAYFDSCGNEPVYSNIGKTIYLEVIIDDLTEQSYLQWNLYEDFNGSTIAYNIYRGIDGILDTNPIESTAGTSRTFTDNLSSIVSSGKICYMVEAIESDNIYNDPRTSESNITCDVIEPLIYIPNAFWPDGINKTFQPVIRNFDASDYMLTIFNRWGQVIFQSNDYNEPWNGGLNNSGELVETGTYVYMIEVHDGFGNEIIRRGHVTLLR